MNNFDYFSHLLYHNKYNDTHLLFLAFGFIIVFLSKFLLLEEDHICIIIVIFKLIYRPLLNRCPLVTVEDGHPLKTKIIS